MKLTLATDHNADTDHAISLLKTYGNAAKVDMTATDGVFLHTDIDPAYREIVEGAFRIQNSGEGMDAKPGTYTLQWEDAQTRVVDAAQDRDNLLGIVARAVVAAPHRRPV